MGRKFDGMPVLFYFFDQRARIFVVATLAWAVTRTPHVGWHVTFKQCHCDVREVISPQWNLQFRR